MALDVSFPCLDEVGAQVATNLPLPSADPNLLGSDPVWLQQPSELHLGDRLAGLPLSPLRIRISCDLLDQVFRTDRIVLDALEYRLGRRQRPSIGGAAVRPGFNPDGGCPCFVAKVLSAGTQISYRQLKLPVVGAPVLQFLRHRRLRIAQGVLIVDSPAAEAAAQVGQFTVVLDA